MSTQQSLYVQALYAGIVLAVLASVTVLGVQGTLTSDSLIAVYGAAIGFAGASASQLGAVGQAINGKATIPTSELANREATLRVAMTAASGQPPTEVEPIAVEEPGH